MLPGVGVFGTGSTARVLVPLLKAEGFEVHALWGRSEDEACCLAKELGIPFHTSRSDDVLLHQDVDLVCIYIPPSMTRQIAVKALGKLSHNHKMCNSVIKIRLLMDIHLKNISAETKRALNSNFSLTLFIEWFVCFC